MQTRKKTINDIEEIWRRSRLLTSCIRTEDASLEMLKHFKFSKVASLNGMSQRGVRDVFAWFTDQGRL